MRRQENTGGIGRRWRQLRMRYLLLGVGVVLGAGACSGSTDPSSSTVQEEAPATTTAQPDTIEATVVEDELELNRGDAREAESVDSAEEFIDIPYWDVHVLDGSFDLRIDTEGCEASEPGVEVCDWEMDIEFFGSLFGRATTYLEGTMTVESDGCTVADGNSGDLTIFRGAGSITTLWGDEAYITNIFGRCGTLPVPNTWRVTGGTGRFEDATGLMNGENVQFGDEENSVYVQNLSTGTIRVRADLWEDWLPAE